MENVRGEEEAEPFACFEVSKFRAIHLRTNATRTLLMCLIPQRRHQTSTLGRSSHQALRRYRSDMQPFGREGMSSHIGAQP